MGDWKFPTVRYCDFLEERKRGPQYGDVVFWNEETIQVPGIVVSSEYFDFLEGKREGDWHRVRKLIRIYWTEPVGNHRRRELGPELGLTEHESLDEPEYVYALTSTFEPLLELLARIKFGLMNVLQGEGMLRWTTRRHELPPGGI